MYMEIVINDKPHRQILPLLFLLKPVYAQQKRLYEAEPTTVSVCVHVQLFFIVLGRLGSAGSGHRQAIIPHGSVRIRHGQNLRLIDLCIFCL